uniref:Uncharacterized protein n=1 Tax=Steinernema glaseri TaxID=37863 RepID=A0A1I8A0N4_9BILA
MLTLILRTPCVNVTLLLRRKEVSSIGLKINLGFRVIRLTGHLVAVVDQICRGAAKSALSSRIFASALRFGLLSSSLR